MCKYPYLNLYAVWIPLLLNAFICVDASSGLERTVSVWGFQKCFGMKENYKSNSLNSLGLIASTPVLIPQPLHAAGFSHGASSAIRGGEAERSPLAPWLRRTLEACCSIPRRRDLISLELILRSAEKKNKKNLHSKNTRITIMKSFFIHM